MHALEWIQREGRFRRSTRTGELRRILGRQKRHCTWCDEPVPGRRGTWCSAKGVADFEVRCSPQEIRSRVRRRDQGVCALCGLDTAALKRFENRLHRARRADDLAGGYPWGRPRSRRGRANWRRLERYRGLVQHDWKLRAASPWRRWLRHRGFNPDQSYWQADHIVPIADGGDEFDPDNIRTLCRPCHKAVTKQWHKGRRKPKEPPPVMVLNPSPQVWMVI